MKYTKDNIIGLYFTCGENSFKFKIDSIDEDYEVFITWGKSSKTSYSLGDALEYLEDKTWKVINQEPTYEIY